MVNKTEFCALMAERCDITKKDAAEQYDDVFAVLNELLCAGNEVSIPNLGRFKIVNRKARTAHNPRTGETIEVPAKKAIKLQITKSIKDAVGSL